MNPLTLVKRTQKINEQEAKLGISEQASWHAKYNDSAYVFVGGVPFDLTEGDLIAVFAQYGEIVDVNLVRDKATRKSKGFAFLAYEDQRSTNLAVDNLNGAQVLGRTVRVDHCSKYKKEEDEETARQKREERGVCRAFQKGECNRGESCKFSHDEKRAANTGWGAEEDRPRWANDKFDGTRKDGHSRQSSRIMNNDRSGNNDMRGYRGKSDGMARDRHQEGSEWKPRDQGSRDIEKRAEKDKGRNYKGEMDRSQADRKSRRPDDEDEQVSREDRDKRDVEKRSENDKGINYKGEMDRSHANRKSKRPDDEQMLREDRDKREEKRLRSESLRREDKESVEEIRRPLYEKEWSPRRQKMNGGEQREDRTRRDEKRTLFESDSHQREERESLGGDKRSDFGRDSSPRHRRTDEDRGHRAHR